MPAEQPAPDRPAGAPARLADAAAPLPRPGDPADLAIAYLIEAQGGRIYSLGLRICGGNPDDAADLVQETFLNAYRGWAGFQGDSDPGTWLYAIAARACQRMRRRRAGEPRHMDSVEDLLPASEAGVVLLASEGEEGPLGGVLRSEAEAMVDAALARIPPAFRIALVLKDIADLSIAEIAAILGLKEATVKTRVHRGRLALRQSLAEGLPRRPAPPPDHPRATCLALLQGKQEALDRGLPFALPDAELCVRCRSLFNTLDLGREACRLLGEGDLPPALHDALAAHYQAA